MNLRFFVYFFFTFAACCCLLLAFTSPSFADCKTSTKNEGLISGLSVTGGGSIGNVDQTCVLDAQAAYREYKVPTYEELEKQFYTLSRSGARSTLQLPNGDLPRFINNGIYLQKGDMSVNSANGSGVQIIFVKGKLTITGNIDYGCLPPSCTSDDPYSGLIFIVLGDINIYSTVTQVNAVLISSNDPQLPGSGKICTAYDSLTSSCLSGDLDTLKLTVNGSLISLNKEDLPDNQPAILFKRNLPNNLNEAAEVINKQAKYLYILRNGLLTKDLILTEEDKNYPIVPDPGAPPPPPPPPPPQPVCPGLTNPFVISTFRDVTNCIIGI